jgi:hypothetical protein
MDSSLQPLLFMAMSKNDNNSTTTIILTFIMILSSYLMRVIPFSEVYDILVFYMKGNHNYISITIPSHEVPVVKGYSMSTTPVTKIVYSKTFLALLYYLSKNKDCKLESLTEILTNNCELNLQKYDKDGNPITTDNEYMFIPLNNEKILISNKNNIKIFCEFSNNENKSTSDDDSSKKTKNNVSNKNNFIIKLLVKKSYNIDISILNDFIKECIDNYDSFLNINKGICDKQYIYEYKTCEKSDSKLQLYFDEYLMEHNKDLLVNIFFEGKDKLIDYITPFIYDKENKINSGEEEYKRAGFTFKAGLLFHGYPGCGKTSTIKAILSYTKRHAIIINLNKVKTCEELENIFRKRIFNDKLLHGKQLCYILEDCDAYEDNIIKSREKNDDADNDPKKISECSEINQIAKLMEMSTLSVKPGSIYNTNSLNLSCFLNILDGIIELHGIMIIMTTNYPEKIDSALVRPGRFDFKYEFKRASKKIIKEMLQFKYNLSKDKINKYNEIMNIKDEIISPAEIQSICFKNKNIEDAINDIILYCQK